MIEGSRIFYPQRPSHNQGLPYLRMPCQECRPDTCVSKGFLFRIGKGFVGFLNFPEFFFVSWRHIGMITLCRLSIRAPNSFRASLLIDTEDLVEILFHSDPRSSEKKFRERPREVTPPFICQPVATLIFCGFAFSTLGRTSRRTPFSILAEIFP